jgi:hypothetical protein
MKVSQLYPGLVIPSANDIFVSSLVCARIGWKCDEIAREMTSSPFLSVKANKAEKDSRRLAKIAKKIRLACLQLDAAARELNGNSDDHESACESQEAVRNERDFV